MKFRGDYHTHSRHSDGRQTVEDIIEAAEQKGLKEVAITDHGPLAAVIGVKNADTYLEIREEIDNFTRGKNISCNVLLGAEANIRDLNGELDLPGRIIKQLDFLIAGLHPYTLPTSIDDGIKIWVQNSLRHFGKAQAEKAVNANTKASVEAILSNPRLKILSHPGLFFKVDVEEVARACIKADVLFEINCGHNHPGISDIMKAEKLGVNFIVNSDSHFKDTVGKLEYGQYIIDKLEIDDDRVFNMGEEA